MLNAILKNSLFRKITNIPAVWDFLHSFVGAEKWKLSLYPSVFEKTGKILDFGCSVGNDTPGFLNFDYTGVDIGCELIEAAKKTYEKYPNVSFVCLDILKQEFKENYFDYVLFACTGHHLKDEELSAILDKLMNNLRVGGELHFFDMISQPGKDGAVTRFFIKIDQGKFMRTADEYDNLWKEKKYSVERRQIFPSPDRLIKLEDMYYAKIIK